MNDYISVLLDINCTAPVKTSTTGDLSHDGEMDKLYNYGDKVS